MHTGTPTAIDQQLTPPGGWHPAGVARIQPLQLAELSKPLRALLWVAGKWGQKRTGSNEVPDVFLLLLRHPRLFWPWLRFASRLMPYGSLGRRESELVILRVGWNCRSRYEWAQHVAIGQREGLTAEEINRVAKGPNAAGWSPQQAALLQAADDLHQNQVMTPETWRQLAAHYKPHQLIEVAMLIGHYQMLAGVLNSTLLSPEPQAEAQLAAAPIHKA